MSTFETHRVCRNCFKNTITKNPPILAKDHPGMKCKSCSLEWVGIIVGDYPPNNRWYEIRPRTFNSENSLCRYKMTGQCYRDWRCRSAHNPLELLIWIEEERVQMNKKRPSQPKFGCIICRIEFRDNDNLKTHLMGNEHYTRTYNMWILPEVGSSIEYIGPIRARPKVPYGKDSYELCRIFARSGRCEYSAGCKHAHSYEELKVWMAALTAKKHEQHDRKYSHSASNKGHSASRSYSSSSQEGACRYPSESSESHSQATYNSSHRKSSSGPDNVEEGPDPIKEVYRRIRDFGIEPCLKNFPKHIQLTCSRSLTITAEEKSKANELKWVFGLKTTQPDYLSLILLHDHKNMFSLGEMAKCSTRGAGRNDMKQHHIPNRTNYLVQQGFNQEIFFEVALLCTPEVGIYKVQVVFQIQDDILIGREVKVKMQGEGFKNITENFRKATKRQPVKVIMVGDLLKVNWENSFELINSNPNVKYPMPIYLEGKVSSDWYDRMNDQLSKEFYDIRFHTLLFLEEFEHKRSLMKYDLQDQKITFHTVEKRITIKNEYGRDFVENAQGESRFITFKLNQRLFEGYRSFRPPKLVYIIPNGTRKAFEYKIFHTGSDYVIVSITTELIKACQCSKGLALVRFTVEHDEYVRMHEALKHINLSVVFPVYKRFQKPMYWDEDHLLSLLDYEQLSMQQNEAVYNIIDSRYQSFPTILCAPFGCGKTKTLLVAAKLIAKAFPEARILITTKTNSCANMYIELLQWDFDTITMLREGRGNKKIMFRHFARTQKLHFNRKVNDFANIENVRESDLVYSRINFFHLKQCTIVVTTQTASATLIPPESRFKSKSLFTHIFIDEAAQMIEPEACIALSLAGPSTKIALAGDIHQSRSLVLSKYGKKYSLDQSLLQRLEMLPEYGRSPLNKCRVNLVENFRSQHTIVSFLSELFYEDSLIAKPPSLIGPVNFPALSFLHVSGEEHSLHGFPSYYNEEEAQLTIKALRKFVAGGVNVDRIAVVTTYSAQVRLIHEALKEDSSKCRKKGHFKYDDQYCIENNCINNRTIEVCNLESIQGREYDLVIVNTVRTVSNVPEELSLEERLDLGLLDDVSQFNTILTRARGWVLVIGDSDCLTQVGGCSNVWTKYVQACQQVNGYFATYREFEAFRMQIGDTKETKGKGPTPNTKKREIPKSKVAISSHPESHLDVCATENTYQSKYNSLQSFLNTCYKELTISTNNEVKEAIHEQLVHTKVAIEAMENQRCLEQKFILSNYQAGNVPLGSVSTLSTDAKVPTLITTKKEIPKSKVSFPSDLESRLDVSATENTHQSKYNLLQSFIQTCHQELMISTNQEVKETINEQLAHAKVAIEAMENQKHLEQKCVISKYQPRNVPLDSVSTVSSEQTSTLLPDMIINEAKIMPTQEQLFPKGPL